MSGAEAAMRQFVKGVLFQTAFVVALLLGSPLLIGLVMYLDEEDSASTALELD